MKKYPFEIANKAHSGQFRRDGITPYINHPADVCSRVQENSDAMAVAWLHDVLEDTDETEESLREQGVEEHILKAVVLLTKKDGEYYEDYLIRVKKNPLAKKVKIADMLSNLSDSPTENQIKKYCRGLLFLLK